MEYVKVKGHDHFVRDPRTNAIINTNKSQYNEYLLHKESKVKEQQKIQELEENVANMKDDLNEIKSLLRSLINGS
jgi:hypothetical protein